MTKFLALFVSAVLAIAASAFDARAQVTYSGPGARVTPPPLNTLNGTVDFERFLRNVTGGQLDIVDRTNGKIGPKIFPIEAARTVTKGAVTRAAIRGAATLATHPLGMVVLAVAAGAAWCKNETGSFVCDKRQATQPLPSWNCSGTVKASPLAACQVPYQAWKDGWGTHTVLEDIKCNPVTPTSQSCEAKIFIPGYGNATWSGSPYAQVSELCPVVAGHPNPAYHVPGGPADADGKCPTGVYELRPEEETVTRVERQIKTAAELEAVVKELLAAGVDLSSAASPTKLSGPATVTEPVKTTTTTSPTGAPLTTTTTTTHNVTYMGDSFTWNTTNITNHPDGSTETKTETPDPPKPECELYPESAGCQKLDKPDGPSIEKKDIPVSYAPDGGWGADGGSCPSPRTVSVLGQPIQIDNSLICQFLSGIRFAVIGAFGLAGVLIFIGGFRE